MGFFGEKAHEYECIYAYDILYNPINKSIVIKNGFKRREMLINEIIDFGIVYGMTYHHSEAIRSAKKQEGGIEKYFSGQYNINEIPPISIFVKLNNNEFVLSPITISKAKKDRTLIVAERIFDRIDCIINKQTNFQEVVI